MSPAAPVSYGRRLRDLATAEPDRPGLIFAPLDGPHRTFTWADLERRANQVGRTMAERGVGLGDRVAIELRNSPEAIEVVLACWKVGAVPITLRWDLPDWERGRVLQVIDGTLDVAGQHGWALLEESRSAAADPLPDVVPPQANGICSSGTTGTPKVIIADRPAVWDPELSQPFPSPWGQFPRPQVVLVPAPLYHTNGFSTLFSLISGDTIVLMEKFDAATTVGLIETYRVNTFTATPAMLQRIARMPDVTERDFSSITWILQGAAVIPPSLVRFWLDLVGPERFFMAYGMTEGLGLTALRGDEWLAHPGSVGKGIRDAEVRIKDGDGRDLPPGGIGEIYLRSPSSGLYQYRGAGRLPTTDDGFATVGDMGWLDEDGYLYIADRRADMIVTGGANVFPAEVENALADHPAIADVVVVGVRDPEWGRRVHAIVEPTDPGTPPSASEVIAFAKERLASYKAPKTVEIVKRIPRSEATKVSRAALVAERGG
ncbi:MAG: class I adenylate-forming enzyme family protein [Actinomycetota bacterium]